MCGNSIWEYFLQVESEVTDALVFLTFGDEAVGGDGMFMLYVSYFDTLLSNVNTTWVR